MPVFGVNDRRQPAVSVISTGTKWSGEISLRNGTSCIVAGDFSTQSINRTQTICRQNRHAAPLNDSRGGLHLCHSASFRDACTQPAVSVISTGTKWIGEISLRNGTSCIVAGDFSTQSINRTQTICRQNRHAAPLNDSRGGAAPVPFCFFQRCLYTARRPCHFNRSRSAANRKASYWAGWRPTSADLETLCRVSTEWRNLTPK